MLEFFIGVILLVVVMGIYRAFNGSIKQLAETVDYSIKVHSDLYTNELTAKAVKELEKQKTPLKDLKKRLTELTGNKY